MGSMFSDDRDISEAELEEALRGGTAGTWAKFRPQQKTAVARSTGVAAGAVQATPQMVATALRIRAARPELFPGEKTGGDPGTVDLTATPNNSPATVRGALGVASTFAAFIANPIATTVGILAKVGISLARTGEPPKTTALAGPMAAFETLEKVVDKISKSGEASDTNNSTAPATAAPVDNSISVQSINADGTLGPVGTYSQGVVTENAPAAGTGTSGDTSSGAGGFGGGYGGDAPSSDGSAYGRE
jgi:hypothetical protein